MRLRFPALILGLSLALLLTACESAIGSSTSGSGAKDSSKTTTTTKPGDSDPKTSTGIVSKWSDREVEDGVEYIDTMDIRANGSVWAVSYYKALVPPLDSDKNVVEGTWVVSGDQITITTGDQTFPARFRVVGNLLILDIPDQPLPDTMFRVP